MDQQQRNASVLVKYMPEKAVPLIVEWIAALDFKLKIKKERSTKLGDYRAPYNGSNHIITINYNLNKYAFLVTLVHEIAHLTTFNKYKNSVMPHGAEWKEEFRIMMQPFLDTEIFPVELLYAIRKYLMNPAASSCTDKNLYRALRLYDENPNAGIYLEKLPLKTVFVFQGNLYEKGPKIRTRFTCKEVRTGRIYLFNSLAEVEVFEDSKPA
ncbi:MAG TPA: SprT-like domain-containing protein [Bacteroidia bacterium]